MRIEFCVHGNWCRTAVRTGCRGIYLTLRAGKWAQLETEESSIIRSSTSRFVSSNDRITDGKTGGSCETQGEGEQCLKFWW